MQLMPCILAAYPDQDATPLERHIRAGCKHLVALREEAVDWKQALTRYNRGPTSARSSGYARKVMRRMEDG